MAKEFNPGGAASLDEAILLRLLNNADVNILTDAEQAKLGHLTVTQAVDLDAMEARVNQLDAAVVLIGSWDASGGSFPGSGSAQAGHSYIVSVAGTVDSVAFAVGDRLIAITDDASTGTYAANWLKLDYTDQVLSVAGLTGAISASGLRTAIDVLTATILASNANGDGASRIGIEDSGGNFTATDVEAALAELAAGGGGGGASVSSGSGAPASTPSAVGDIYIDTTADIPYIATGTASSADWLKSNMVFFDAGGSSSATRPTANTNVLVIWHNHGSSDPTNAEDHDIIMGQGRGIAVVNDQSGTTYTLVLDDAGYAVDMSNASANTVTIPTNASVAFPVGATITINQLGAGTTTIEGDTGVTVNGTSGGSVDINNQYSGCVIRKTATNTWIAQGDIT
jgi:hypothetical protein